MILQIRLRFGTFDHWSIGKRFNPKILIGFSSDYLYLSYCWPNRGITLHRQGQLSDNPRVTCSDQVVSGVPCLIHWSHGAIAAIQSKHFIIHLLFVRQLTIVSTQVYGLLILLVDNGEYYPVSWYWSVAVVTPSQSPGPCQVVNTGVMFRHSQESGKTAVSSQWEWSAVRIAEWY